MDHSALLNGKLIFLDGDRAFSRNRTMLVLSRKVGQRILIGDHIAVTVVRVAQGAVRIGIEAPDNFAIVREEIKQSQEELPEDGKLVSGS